LKKKILSTPYQSSHLTTMTVTDP